jgi:type II secretory pathway pseudopilin PulG
MFLKNEKGFSLAEVMVAAGLLGALSLAVNQLIMNQSKSVKTVEKKFELVSTASTIRTILSDRAACHNTFGINAGPPATGTYDPNNVAAGTITEIRNRNDDVMFESNTDPSLAKKYGNGQIKIISLSLSSANTAPIPANSTGLSELTIVFNRGGAIYGTETISKVIQLNTRTDAAGILMDCGTTAVNDLIANTTALCDAIGGTYDPTGRSGAGDCHTLQPNNQTTLTGDLVVGGASTLNGDTIVNGNVSVEGNLTIQDTYAIELLSDRRLKYDINPLESSLDKIDLMDTVDFRWRKNSRKDVGLIAQNVQAIYPELVSKTEKGFLAVKYSNLIAIALSGIKEQQVQIRELNTKLEKANRKYIDVNEELALLKKIICKEKEKEKLEICK